MKFPSEHARVMYTTATSLGYRFVRRDSGHWVYVHDHERPFSHSGTPSSSFATTRALADLRRRHPEAAVFQRENTKRPAGKRIRKPRRPSRPVSLVAVPDPEPVRSLTRVGGALRVRFYRCRDCMKPWNDEAHFPASECPLCRSRSIDVDPPRRAAA